MSQAAIHLAHRNRRTKRQRLSEARPSAIRNPVRPDHSGDSEDDGLRLSPTPLSDPVEILQHLPARAIMPALLEMLDLMSGPIMLVENSPMGECREAAANRAVLALTA